MHLGAISALAGGIKAGSKAMKNELQEAVDDIERALEQVRKISIKVKKRRKVKKVKVFPRQTILRC